MNAQKKIDPEANLISYTLNSFSSEAEMDLFVNFFEKIGKEFFENLKRYGLIRWRLNQVWNKDGIFQLASLFEYKDEEAYKKSIEEIVNWRHKHEHFFNKINVKRTASRTVNLLDFY